MRKGDQESQRKIQTKKARGREIMIKKRRDNGSFAIHYLNIAHIFFSVCLTFGIYLRQEVF
jgi:hypothetical protein